MTSTEALGSANTGTGQDRPTPSEQLAEEGEPVGSPPLLQTPSQTVGPFFGYALPYPGGPALVPAGSPRSVLLHGTVFDGNGIAVPDALLELWQPDADGRIAHRAGSRDSESSGFTGFGRASVDAAGRYAFRTVLPGATAPGSARWALVAVFARGLLHHLFTRAYFVPHGEPEPSDPLLERLDPARRATLLARPDADGYRFDVRLQGQDETVFLNYPAQRPREQR